MILAGIYKNESMMHINEYIKYFLPGIAFFLKKNLTEFIAKKIPIINVTPKNIFVQRRKKYLLNGSRDIES